MKKTITKIAVFLGVCILLSLGVWQLFRMSYKESIISELEAKSEMPIIAPHEIGEEYLYRTIEVCGHFKKDKDLFVYFKPNYILMAPFYVENTGREILVARGQARTSDKDNVSLLIDNEEKSCIAGMLAPSEKEPLFMPAYDGSPKKPLLSINTKSASNILQENFYDMYIILTDKPKNTLLIPLKKPSPRNIYNNHLEYALTWFILAAILTFMYVASNRNANKKPLKKGK